MAAASSVLEMGSVPGPEAARCTEGSGSLLQTFQAHVEDMRNLVLCKICIRPLYEPYTLGCGHTYCYSCLTSWFGGAPRRKERKNCPDCRTSVTVQPSPNYLLRDLVHMFISRVEFLPEDETTAEHDEAKRLEAQLIETDRTTRTAGEPGLFKGAFCQARLQIQGPIRDEEDGVLRCPVCAWEMEDGECGQCGYADEDAEFYEGEDGQDYDTVGSRSVTNVSSDVDIDYDDSSNPLIHRQSAAMRADIREWVSEEQAARRARRAATQTRRNNHRDRASTADTEATDSTMTERYHDYPGYGMESENGVMAAIFERGSSDNHRWDTDNAETMDEDEDEDEDEEMTSTTDAEDSESTTSFHRAAISARDRGLNPRFESDVSTHASEEEGEGEIVINGGSSPDESTESDDSGTPEPTPSVQRLASRPARIVVDSEDESSNSSSSEDEEGNEDNENDFQDQEDDESSENDPTPSPPRPAAVRQARVQMHRGRRGGRGRGRPRIGN